MREERGLQLNYAGGKGKSVVEGAFKKSWKGGGGVKQEEVDWRLA